MLRQFASLTALMIALVMPVQAKPDLADIAQLIEAGQFRQALSQLDELKASDQTNPHYLFYRARALAASGQRDKAIKQYQALIKAEPNLPEPYNNLAAIYMQQGRIDKARALLDKAMQTHPAYARVYKNLATVNAAGARDAYARALQMPAPGQASGLEIAGRLSLPDKAVPSARPIPVVTAAAKPDVRPAMVYQAKNGGADKNTAPPAGKAPDGGTGFAAATAVLQAWARAWSAKNVDQYLQFYSDSYSPPGMTRRHWEDQRRTRIGQPKWIRVKLRNIKLKSAHGQQLRIQLEQEYAADNYSDVTRKEFVLQNTAGAWRIIDERGLGYITR